MKFNLSAEIVDLDGKPLLFPESRPTKDGNLAVTYQPRTIARICAESLLAVYPNETPPPVGLDLMRRWELASRLSREPADVELGTSDIELIKSLVILNTRSPIVVGQVFGIIDPPPRSE